MKTTLAKSPAILLLLGLASSAQAGLVFSENFDSATVQATTSTNNPLGSNYNFASGNQAGISASAGLGGSQALLPGGLSGAAVETQFVYNLAAIDFSSLTVGDSGSAIRMSLYFLRGTTPTGVTAYPELGLQAESTTFINPAPGNNNANVSLRLNSSTQFNLRANNGTRPDGATGVSSALTLTGGNWYQFQVDFWRDTSTSIKATGYVYNSDSSGVLGSLVSSWTSPSWTTTLGADSTTYAILRTTVAPEAGTVDPAFDNWTVMTIPEPSAAALLAAGIGAGLIGRRRRN